MLSLEWTCALLYFINKQKMFGASDTFQHIKMLMDTCCSCDFFFTTSQPFFFPPSEGDYATDFSMFIIFMINDTATYFFLPTAMYIFLLAFKCCLLCVSCYVTCCFPENRQCSCPVASGIASRWMEGDLI